MDEYFSINGVAVKRSELEMGIRLTAESRFQNGGTSGKLEVGDIEVLLAIANYFRDINASQAVELFFVYDNYADRLSEEARQSLYEILSSWLVGAATLKGLNEVEVKELFIFYHSNKDRILVDRQRQELLFDLIRRLWTDQISYDHINRTPRQSEMPYRRRRKYPRWGGFRG